MGSSEVKKDSSFDDAAQWINQGGRAIVVDRWRDFEMCRKTLLKPLRQKPASAKDAEPRRDNYWKSFKGVTGLFFPHVASFIQLRHLNTYIYINAFRTW